MLVKKGMQIQAKKGMQHIFILTTFPKYIYCPSLMIKICVHYHH